MSRWVWLVLGLSLGLGGSGAAQPLGQEDFSREAGGWVDWAQPEQPSATAPGRSGPALRLTGSGEAPPNWQVSPPLPAGATGYLTLRMQVRRVSGEGDLLLSLAGGESGRPLPAHWRGRLAGGDRWRSVELLLTPPAGGPWRLALAAAGEAEWLVDDLSLEEVRPRPPAADPLLAGLRPAAFPPPLPAGWEPQGTLDAQTREIGPTVELLVPVGGLSITLPAEVAVPRGSRAGVSTLVDNRGQGEKLLTITVQGPPGSAMPSYTFPIRGQGVTGFSAPFQVMQTGEQWLKLTFTVGEESASAPLRVRATRTYPALMRGPQVESAPPDALPWQLAVTDWGGLPPQPGEEALVRLPLPAADPLGDWAQQARGAAADSALLQVPGALPSDLPAVLEAYRTLHEQVLPQAPGPALVSPTWEAQPSPGGLRPAPLLEEAVAGGLGAHLHSLAFSLARLPSGAVLTEKLEGRVPTGAQPGWGALLTPLSPTGLREWLHDQGLRLPLLLDLSTATGPGLGSGPAAGALLTRLLLELAWQGATGLALSPPRLAGEGEPDAADPSAPLREVWRELAGAYPVWVPETEADFCSRAADTPLTYWAFARAHEGIVFLANNSSVSQEVAVELRAVPVQMQVLRLCPLTSSVTRQIQDVFRFSEEAHTRRQSAVYLRLEPGEVVGLSILLQGSDASWLRALGRKPTDTLQRPPIRGPKPIDEKEVPWWLR